MPASAPSYPGLLSCEEFLYTLEMVVGMTTEGRGFSNAKAKRELGWALRYPSWRQGFREGLG